MGARLCLGQWMVVAARPPTCRSPAPRRACLRRACLVVMGRVKPAGAAAVTGRLQLADGAAVAAEVEGATMTMAITRTTILSPTHRCAILGGQGARRRSLLVVGAVLMVFRNLLALRRVRMSLRVWMPLQIPTPHSASSLCSHAARRRRPLASRKLGLSKPRTLVARSSCSSPPMRTIVSGCHFTPSYRVSWVSRIAAARGSFFAIGPTSGPGR